MNVRRTISRLAVLLFLACLLAVLGGPPAGALAARTAPEATFNVNSTADTHDANPGNGTCADASSHCTLRAAVEEANALAGADTINLPAGTYDLTLGSIAINSTVTIDGANRATTIVDGSSNTGRAFYVGGSDVLELHDVTLQDFDAGASYGGAIAVISDGTLTINNSNLSNNDARGGGAIYCEGDSTVTINTSTLSGNSTSENGGAISCHGGLAVTINNSTLSGNSSTSGYGGAIDGYLCAVGLNGSGVLNNTADDGGGGIAVSGSTGSLTCYQCAISGNVAEGVTSGGGGIYVGSGASVVIENSVVENNTAHGVGGGIFATANNQITLSFTRLDGNTAQDDGGGMALLNSAEMNPTDVVMSYSSVTGNWARYGGGVHVDFVAGSHLYLTDSTVSGNESERDGGGIYVDRGAVELRSVTVADNTADVDADDDGNGGGIYVASAGTVAFQNTIVATNEDGSSGPFAVYLPDCVGTLTAEGFVLVGRQPGLCTIAGNLAGSHVGTVAAPLDPLLGPLERDGYLTDYQPLLEGSLAVDGGNPSGCRDHSGALLTEDQRGEVRHYSNGCDVGAYESLFTRWFIYLPLLGRGG